MKILHITLGLPPWRSGGLTNYSVDLMKAQCQLGHVVSLLYPGSIRCGSVKIRSNRNYGDISVFEIINPLPVSLIYGILQPARFIEKGDRDTFTLFLLENKFNIIHVHTIMGIHKEFFLAAKRLGVKVVFTTHDYFGLCLTTNLLKRDNYVCDNPNPKDCAYCCKSGMSYNKSKMMQSKIYRIIKNISFMKNIKRKVKADIQKDLTECNSHNKFNEILLYYREILMMIDYFHFNSNITREIYQKHINVKGKVLAITMADIADTRLKRTITKADNILRIGYIGTKKSYKGYEWMKYCINQKNPRFQYHLFGMDFNKEDSFENIICHGTYNRDEMEKVFSYMDVLVIPSIWYETFGLVGLEALSFGVPILVSDRVGIKDIVENIDKKCIISTKKQLFDALNRLDDNIEYKYLIDKVKRAKIDFDIKNHAYKVLQIYNN